MCIRDRYIVASLGAACGEIPYTVYMANDAYMQENPEVIEAFTRAIYRGQQWVDTHTAAEIAEVILPQFPDSDLETLTSILERYQAQDTWKTDPTFSKESYERLQDIMEQLSLIHIYTAGRPPIWSASSWLATTTSKSPST